MAPAIAWDLVVTRDGCSVLEGNGPPDVFVWEVHTPLLADPRVRRFYEDHGVICLAAAPFRRGRSH